MRMPLLFTLCLTAVSCATVVRGTSDTLVVESDPAGADVRVSTGEIGQTPISFSLPRKGTYTVTISKEGYETVDVIVNHRLAGAGAAANAGNLLVGGLIGAAIDAGSGAKLDLYPNPVSVTLVPIGRTGEPSTLDRLASEAVGMTRDEVIALAKRPPDLENATTADGVPSLVLTYTFGGKSVILRLVDGKVVAATML